jgi:hypothetical protein
VKVPLCDKSSLRRWIADLVNGLLLENLPLAVNAGVGVGVGVRKRSEAVKGFVGTVRRNGQFIAVCVAVLVRIYLQLTYKTFDPPSDIPLGRPVSNLQKLTLALPPASEFLLKPA